MTDKEQIKCKYKFQDKEKLDGKPYCVCFNELCEDLYFVCDDNCQIYEDYKQLTRKTQECEQKEKELKELKRQYKLSCLDCEYKNTKTDADRYRKALEEIEKVINNILNSCLGRNTVSCRPAHNVCGDLINILDIINKAKGEGND